MPLLKQFFQKKETHQEILQDTLGQLKYGTQADHRLQEIISQTMN
jgi:hypothetical protein